MPNEKIDLLIVDDDLSLRRTLSVIFAELGYKVRSAQDGLSALVEVGNVIPDIILSDLNMPGMSGFELLSIVRLRFPAIPLIAMSGAYSGDGVPPEVVADAFYEKGTNVAALLRVVEALSRPGRSQPVHPHSPLTSTLVPGKGQDLAGGPHLMITCPECLRTFAQVVDEAALAVQETDCFHCHSLIHYSIVKPVKPAASQVFERKLDTGSLTSLSLSDTN